MKVFILIFLIINSITYAQNSISGKVMEKDTREVLIGASVAIKELKTGAITDVNGNYVIKSVPNGVYLIIAKSINHNSKVQTIEVNGNINLDIELEQSNFQTNEVVVTGQSEASELDINPLPISTISQTNLLENSGTNIIDALTRVPGVNSISTGPNISKPSIRGLGYNRIVTLFDGSRQEGQQWGDEHGIEVDEYSVDHAEIIKGPSSLIYGSDALAGVLNLIPTKYAQDGKTTGDILAEYQSNNGLFGASGIISGTKEGTSWLLRLSHKSATNYQNKIDERVYGTAFSETDASGSGSMIMKNVITTIHFSLYNNLQEVPDGSRDSVTRKFTKQINEADTVREIVSDKELRSYRITDLHQKIEYYRICTDNTFYLGDSHIDLTLSVQRSVRREYSHPEFKDTPGLFLKLNTFGYNVNYTIPKLMDWNLSAGINGMYQTNDVTSGTEFVIPSYKQLDAGAFLTFNRNFGLINLSAGLRYDIRSFKNYELYTIINKQNGFEEVVGGNDTIGAERKFSDYNHLFGGLTGSTGMTYTPDENLSFKFNIARGFRAPNVAEISANGVHPGTNIYQIGNQNFKPEFNLQEDFEFLWKFKNYNFSVSLFNNNIENYIYNRKVLGVNGFDSVIVKGNQTFSYVQSKARLYGGESSVEYNPFDDFQLIGNVSVILGYNLGSDGNSISDSTKYIPFIPPVHGNFEVKYTFPEDFIRNAKLFIKPNLEYYFAQNRIMSAYNTETATKGYVLFNITLGCNVIDKNKNPIVDIYLIINNIFDIAYQNHLSRLKYFEPYPGNTTGHSGIYGMGRNINFKVNIPL